MPATLKPATPRPAAMGRRYVLLAAAAVFVYFYALGDSPLDRTEPHRALVAHQMVLSHQWLIPRLFGEVYLRKPPLIYWAEGAAEKLFGHGGEFVWRFPSAIGSVLLVLGTAFWTGRYFGRAAAIPAGFALLSMLPLWEQDRGADIDALNTAAAASSAMLTLSILHPQTRRRWWLVPPLGIAIGCTLLLKGPGGLPPVLGAVIGPAVVPRSWPWLRRPAFWVSLLIGIGCFVGYGVLAKMQMRRENIVPTTDGFREALQRLILHRWDDILPALTAPLKAVLFAVPASIALALVWVDRSPTARAGAVKIVVAAVAAGFLFFVIAGNGNERYEYVLLPLIAPVAGWVVAASEFESEAGPSRQRRALRYSEDPGIQSTSEPGVTRSFATSDFCAIAFRELWCGIQLVVTAIIWKPSDHRIALAIAAGIALVACHLPYLLRRTAWSPLSGWTAALMIPLLIVPMGQRKNIERSKKSARLASTQLRDIVGDSTVGVASMNRDMPELLYYAGMPVHAFGERGLDKLSAHGGQWVVLTQNKKFPEYQQITTQIPGAFPRGVQKLLLPQSVHYDVYVGWYDPPAGHPAVLLPAVPPGVDEADE